MDTVAEPFASPIKVRSVKGPLGTSDHAIDLTSPTFTLFVVMARAMGAPTAGGFGVPLMVIFNASAATFPSHGV